MSDHIAAKQSLRARYLREESRFSLKNPHRERVTFEIASSQFQMRGVLYTHSNEILARLSKIQVLRV